MIKFSLSVRNIIPMYLLFSNICFYWNFLSILPEWKKIIIPFFISLSFWSQSHTISRVAKQILENQGQYSCIVNLTTLGKKKKNPTNKPKKQTHKKPNSKKTQLMTCGVLQQGTSWAKYLVCLSSSFLLLSFSLFCCW